MYEQLINFSQVYGKVEHEVLKKSKPESITMLQYKLILLLDCQLEKTPGELADCLNLSLPNTSRELRILSELDIIMKSKDPNDKRKQLVKLTPFGMETLENAKNIIKDEINNIFSHLSNPDQAAISNMLLELTRAFNTVDL